MLGPIIAVDFDGTLCDSVWPGTGEPIWAVIDMLKRRRRYENAKIILWTCRTDKALDAALKWCDEHGIKFDAVNENLPELMKEYNNDSRKIYADEYIDDKAVNALLYQDLKGFNKITRGDMLNELQQWKTHMACTTGDGDPAIARSTERSIEVIKAIMEEIRRYEI